MLVPAELSALSGTAACRRILCVRGDVRIRMKPEGELEATGPQADPAAVPAPAGDVLALQRTMGNQAVARAMLLRNGGDTATKTLAEEFDEAVKASQWSRAVACLNRMGDAEIQAALKPVSNDTLTKLDAAALLTFPAGDHKVRRHLVSRRNPPPAGAEHTWADVNDKGTVGYTGKVGSGTVEARTGVKYEDAGGGKKYNDGFSFSYEGADAGKMRWLQFIWREIIVEHPKKGTFPLADKITTSGGEYQLTADPSKPSFNTDAGKDTPFYDDAGHSNRTADAVSMFDMPSAAMTFVQTQFKGAEKATKVISRAHFTTYLVKDMEVLQRIATDVEWTFTSEAEPPRVVKIASGAAANALDPEQRKVLVKQHPKFAYLP
jgi:hypothetical protein